jgi:hypothetical protein
VIVHRLDVDAHPLLRELSAYLDTVQPPQPPYDEKGDWRADVDAGPPAEDRPKPRAFRRQFMERPLRLPSMPDDTILSALNFYPPGGSGLGWHTDTGHPGWRVYLGRPLTHLPGAFLVPDGIFLDEPGIATAFYVSGKPCESWHAVRAFGARLSVGLRIAGDRTARALGLAGACYKSPRG